MVVGAWSGIRVLDFTRVLAGPLCTMMLADLGADVIKVENPKTGDDTRAWGPPWAGAVSDRMSAYFLSVNRNKRSITLDLKSAEGQQIARELAAQSHLVIENFKVGQMRAFGLDYDTLKVDHPELVYCSLTGYGQYGVYAEHPGYDYVVQAMSGLMSITGEVAGDPIKVGVAISDVIAGLYTASAVQAALRHAEQTGVGQYIDMALLDTQMSALVNVASNYLVSGENPPRYGNQHQNIVPYQTFHALDGDFVLAVGNDRQFALLCQIINRPEWINDPRFSTNPARVANRTILIDALQMIFQTQPVQNLVDQLLAVGIPSGPIQTVAQAFRDQHAIDRGLIDTTQLSNGARVEIAASPLKLSQTPPTQRYAPPLLGEHTREVLTEVVGLDEATIEQYRAAGIL